jgi:anti-sigma B factor antagonist
MEGGTTVDADLSVDVHRDKEVPVLDLSGDIDSFTCAKLRRAITELLRNGDCRVVISMAKVRYIDSSGLGTLVGGLSRAREKNGDLAISGANPQIRKVLNITGLSKVFNVFEDDSEAARSLRNDE